MEDHVFKAGEVAGIAKYRGLCHKCNEFYELTYSEEDKLPVVYIYSEYWGPVNKMDIFAPLRETRCPHCNALFFLLANYADTTHDPAEQYFKRQEIIDNVINLAEKGR